MFILAKNHLNNLEITTTNKKSDEWGKEVNKERLKEHKILYLRQEGRGIGLVNKIKAYNLQDQGADTVEANERLGFGADERDYSICAPMLQHLGVRRIDVMTNNPRKIQALVDMGFEVANRVPISTDSNPHNAAYLKAKACKLGHLLGD